MPQACIPPDSSGYTSAASFHAPPSPKTAQPLRAGGHGCSGYAVLRARETANSRRPHPVSAHRWSKHVLAEGACGLHRIHSERATSSNSEHTKFQNTTSRRKAELLLEFESATLPYVGTMNCAPLKMLPWRSSSRRPGFRALRNLQPLKWTPPVSPLARASYTARHRSRRVEPCSACKFEILQ